MRRRRGDGQRVFRRRSLSGMCSPRVKWAEDKQRFWAQTLFCISPDEPRICRNGRGHNGRMLVATIFRVERLGNNDVTQHRYENGRLLEATSEKLNNGHPSSVPRVHYAARNPTDRRLVEVESLKQEGNSLTAFFSCINLEGGESSSDEGG